MDPAAGIAALLVVSGAVAVVALWRRGRGRSGSNVVGTAGGSRDATALYALAARLEPFYSASAHPADLLAHETFREGVALLRDARYVAGDLAAYFVGDNAIIACMAAEALRERGETGAPEQRVLDALGSVAPWSLYLGTRYLAGVVPPERPLVGRVLARTTGHLDYRLSREFLCGFVAERVRRGETPGLADELARLDAEELGKLAGFLPSLDDGVARTLQADLERWRRERVDTDLLATIGSLWGAGDAASDGVIAHASLERELAALEAELTAARRRSVLLVGESGVGKTVLARALARRLQSLGWLVFEAGPTDLVAGQVYYGQFEQRMQQLLPQLRGQRVLWIVPDFHGLAESGTHRHSTISALDHLLPHIESGEIAVLGECRPGAFEQLALARPRIATALAVRRLAPLPARATLELARSWWARHAEPEGRDAVLAEAWELAQQYLGNRAAPGNLLRLLEITWQRLTGAERGRPAAIRVDDLIVTLSGITGLPARILDDRQGLDLQALRRHFAARVVGQPEAIECLVECVAMVKAGLTDPTRPFGVFLFAGPTGTGKTEIAKSLASFLFGSPDRMIRVDMSELQSPEDLERLVGSDGQGARRDALVDRIREQPFSVVLLDEFEKAHHRSWDLFLQVFDDGRLTDRRGQLADFRYSILVLTSNLGAVIPSGERLGFGGGADAFSSRDVLRAIERAFRPEFLNRLDRVVVFRPLDRETMRGILRKELDDVLQRRGLRARPWAVEWDPAAIEFLLEEGFSPTLGARPLKRAVERHLLAPLARTIVAHEFPVGDQFLYVTLRERALDVQFIDPDAPTGGPAAVDADAASRLELASIARDAHGSSEELDYLEGRFARLREAVESEAWRERKQMALDLTGLPDFWRSADRFEILGQYEYQGRIEAGMRRTGSLLGRLRGRQRERLPEGLLASVAQTLLLLETACADVEEGRPHAAFLEVLGGGQGGLADAGSDRFAEQVGRMYLAWADKRRMLIETLAERSGDASAPYRLLLSVSGFGCYSILGAEDGLHVLENPAETSRGFQRDRARVRVTAQVGDPGDGGRDALLRLAESALCEETVGEPRIVRRYRAAPSPLVRDSVRGWRTGRLDRVLGGDFDLMAEA